MINEDLKEIINNLMYAIDREDLNLILYKELRKLNFKYDDKMTQEKYFKLQENFNNLYDILFKEV